MKLPARKKLKAKPTTHSKLSGQHQLKITGINHQGEGVAKLQNKTVFIPNSLPQDEVLIEIIQDETQLAYGKVIEFINRSPEYQKPFCQHYGKCGGCQLQHQKPSAQIYWKEQNLLQNLKSHNLLNKTELTPTPPYLQTENYRRRAKMTLVKDPKTKQSMLGFKEQNSNKVLDIENCPLLVEKLNSALPKLRKELLPLASRQEKDIYLVATETGVWASGKDYLSNPNPPTYRLNNLEFSFAPDGFIQVNAQINEKLVNQAINWLEIQPQDKILDLFCGIGNFSLPMAQKAQKVVGVEGNKTAVELAELNAKQNKLTNLEFYLDNLFEPQNHYWLNQKFDALLLDPGRQGAKEICEIIEKFAANKLIYVSCQSSSLIRDMQLLKAQGYKLKKLQVFDMFSHTTHFETLALLEK